MTWLAYTFTIFCVNKIRYRFRCYPTPEQLPLLARTFGACRYVYNFGLRLRTDSYKSGKTINYHASSSALTVLKKQPETTWLSEVSCVPTQQALRHLQTAFKAFFEKRAKYPTFKSKRGKQAAEYTRSAFTWRAETKTLTIAKVGRLHVRWSRPFVSTPSTVTLTKDRAGRYFVTLCLEESLPKLPKTKAAVGIDFGLNRLATLSTGERIANPKHTARYERKLAQAQRVLSRRQKDSRRWQRARLRVAKIQAKIADTRTDYLHKMTTDLVRRFDTICIEDLNVRGMVCNRHLAKSLADASFGNARQMLAYKCAWYGKTLETVDRFFPSSKRCSTCGYIMERLPLDIRTWTCPQCSTVHDRDQNASRNILRAGHAPQGGRGRRARASAVERSDR